MPPAVGCTNSPLEFAGSQGYCRHQHLDVVTGAIERVCMYVVNTGNTLHGWWKRAGAGYWAE